MTTLREAAQQALEQLKINRTNFRKGPSKSICKMLAGGNDEAIADLEAALAEPCRYADQCNEEGWCTNGCEARVALAEPVQEPVASLMTHIQSGAQKVEWNDDGFDLALWHETPLYTAPPQRKPLTEAEIRVAAMEAFDAYWDEDDETLVNNYGHGVYLSRFVELARAIEAAHGIGGNDE